MPTRKTVDRGKPIRARIRWYVLDAMIRSEVNTQAKVVERTRIDKSALNKFLDPEGNLTLGMDSLAKLTAGLNISANAALHDKHPAEWNEQTRAKLEQFMWTLRTRRRLRTTASSPRSSHTG